MDTKIFFVWVFIVFQLTRIIYLIHQYEPNMFAKETHETYAFNVAAFIQLVLLKMNIYMKL